MIKLKDLIKEFVPGTMLDARKKPGDYWKGAITNTWYARSPKYGWRNSFDTEEEAKMWAEEGKDLEGYDEETAEHPPEPIEETVNEAASYPSFEVDKNIRYKDTVVAKGYWTYTGKESGGKGVYLNTSNQQRLGFDKDDLSYFKKHLPDHFQINEAIKGKFIITNKAKDSFMKSYRKGLLGSKWTNNKEEAKVFATRGSANTVIRMFPVHHQRNWRIMNLEESVNEDTISYSVGFPIVRKFADRLSFGPKLARDGNTFFLQGHMKIDNAAIKKELQRHYEIRRIDRGSRGSNEYYVYDKDSGYVMLVQPSKKDNWIQMSPFTTIEDWKKYE